LIVFITLSLNFVEIVLSLSPSINISARCDCTVYSGSYRYSL